MVRQRNVKNACCLLTIACMANHISQGYDSLSDEPGVIASWLLECVERHFATEEAFLKSADPEKLDSHKLAHKELTQAIARIAGGARATSCTAVEELLVEIRKWVERHSTIATHGKEGFESGGGHARRDFERQAPGRGE